MNLLVFGSSGMLGSTLFENAKNRGINVTGLSKVMCDVTKQNEIIDAIQDHEPDIIINAAGIIPENSGKTSVYSDHEMMWVNAVSPLVIAQIAKMSQIKMIHISTDCVFSGDNMKSHSSNDVPDAKDLYGVSKRAGELCAGKGVTVIRTSFIGPQHGLLNWFLNQPDRAIIEGWKDAYWSGSTVYAVVDRLLDLLERDIPDGIQHLTTEEPITKFQLLEKLLHYRPDINIVPTIHPVGRELVPSLVLPPIQNALIDLKEFL